MINSIELKNYFGKKSEKWIPELTKMVEKYKMGDLEVNDKNIKELYYEKGWYKKIKFDLGVFKFSWLGLFFGSFWACYHKSFWWWQILLVSWVFDIILALILDSTFVFPSGCVIQAMHGKSLLLVGKARELNSTGKLNPPSWKRALPLIIFFLILFVISILTDPEFLYLFYLFKL